MHFGAVVRDILSASCGSDLRQASVRTEIPALRSPQTQRLLAANLATAFGVTIPDHDLDRLSTVRDVLQCVRLHRWVSRVEAGAAAVPVSSQTGTRADASAPIETQPYPGSLRLRRRPSTAPLPSLADTPPPGRREEHR